MKRVKKLLASVIAAVCMLAVAVPLSAGAAVLRTGSTGTQVRELQLELNIVSDSDLVCDGIYGNATKAAVRSFQLSEGITADGIAGAVTEGRINGELNELAGGAYSGSVTASTLRVRDRSGLSGNTIGYLPSGTTVAVLGSRNGWYSVKYSGGYGFVSASYVSTSSAVSKSSINRVIMSYVGCPYSQSLAGSYSPDGRLYVDCSYLTKRIFAEFSVTLPRNAADQAKYCKDRGLTTSSSSLAPGDLIFYSSYANGRYMNITHVAIYAGNGYIVDASSSRSEVVYRKIWGTPILYCRASSLL